MPHLRAMSPLLSVGLLASLVTAQSFVNVRTYGEAYSEVRAGSEYSKIVNPVTADTSLNGTLTAVKTVTDVATATANSNNFWNRPSAASISIGVDTFGSSQSATDPTTGGPKTASHDVRGLIYTLFEVEQPISARLMLSASAEEYGYGIATFRYRDLNDVWHDVAGTDHNSAPIDLTLELQPGLYRLYTYSESIGSSNVNAPEHAFAQGTISAVPEPASIVALGLGVIALRRRRAAR